MIEAQQKIIKLMEESEALINGHFGLSSGLHSEQYFQCAKLLQYPKNAQITAEMLAEFAVESAKAAEMFGISPKVALLSFSTNGSADTEETQKVRLATKLAIESNSGYEIDGEMQFDAAFVPSVGTKKYPESNVAGIANTFIFPDLNSGNIGYKIAQRLGNFDAMGPILAGLNSPVNDLSRGCSAEDVYKTAIITASQVLIN